MRLETVVGMKIEILDGRKLGLFSNEPFEKRPVMSIEDFHLQFDNYFESPLVGNRLMRLEIVV